MFRIWAKVMREDRIVKQYVYEREKKYSHAEFFRYVADICEKLDIPTPLVLKTHIVNYAKFNSVTFRAGDFVEEIDFDRLLLENIL